MKKGERGDEGINNILTPKIGKRGERKREKGIHGGGMVKRAPTRQKELD